MQRVALCFVALGLTAAAQVKVGDTKHCTARGGCACDCSWANPGSCKTDDGSCCFACCCGSQPPPTPPTPPSPPVPPSPPGSPITPKEMQQLMGLGINLGNTLDAPTEGSWAPAAKESFFDEYKARGFTNVRIPVQWGHHLGTGPPYTVDSSFMDRVEQVVDWSLARGFVTILNTHHDEWMECSTGCNFDAALPRFVALWTQISERFKAKNETLLFEVYNEPHDAMTTDQLNRMNAAVLPVMRANNPTRIVIFGGLQYMNPTWITSNPEALYIPENDTQLMLEVHYYDPYKYAGASPTSFSWGSQSDLDALESWISDIDNWSSSHGLPIYYGEFGCTKKQSASTGRYTWYKAHADAIKRHGFAAAVWDDDGNYGVYDRNADQWDNALITALGKHPA